MGRFEMLHRVASFFFSLRNTCLRYRIVGCRFEFSAFRLVLRTAIITIILINRIIFSRLLFQLKNTCLNNIQEVIVICLKINRNIHELMKFNFDVNKRASIYFITKKHTFPISSSVMLCLNITQEIPEYIS